MKTRIIIEHASGGIVICDGSPDYYLEAPVNTIALTPDGTLYRKTTTEGSAGWVLICREGGPRLGALLGDGQGAHPVLTPSGEMVLFAPKPVEPPPVRVVEAEGGLQGFDAREPETPVFAPPPEELKPVRPVEETPKTSRKRS